ncbi:MAG: ribosome maturation factor RimP [Burkholderia sp.]|nr:ribosome maturation factor RimP [Burkholderia sp.]
MQLTELIETTVVGLGYELLELELIRHKTICVYIDQHSGISINDCERATRQLQRVLTVEKVDYKQLEVSSPGLNRPLKKLEDFKRFIGRQVSVTLKKPINGRRTFSGVLNTINNETIIFEFEKDNNGTSLFNFTVPEIDKASLIPQVNFTGKKQ